MGMLIIFIIILILYIILIFIFLFVLLLPMLRGAIFVASRNEAVEKIIAIAKIKPGMKAADLGSGDGRIVIALAKAGAEAHGYEINPLLVWLSRLKIRKEKLENKAFIHWKSFWRCDFTCFDVVTIYGINYIMKNLEKKLQRELQSGAKVISNAFTFPNWIPTHKEDRIYLYKKM